MFPELGIRWLITFSAYRLHSNKSHFRRLSNKNNPPPRIEPDLAPSPAPLWWKRDISGHVSGFEIWFVQTACVSTVPNTSSGLTVHPKHVVGLRSCSLRKEHPTVSALKSTAISAHHKILTCACSVARCPQNCITVQLTVKAYHKISLTFRR